MVSMPSMVLAGARSRHNEIQNRLRHFLKEIVELSAANLIKISGLEFESRSICVTLSEAPDPSRLKRSLVWWSDGRLTGFLKNHIFCETFKGLLMVKPV